MCNLQYQSTWLSKSEGDLSREKGKQIRQSWRVARKKSGSLSAEPEAVTVGVRGWMWKGGYLLSNE